MDQDLLVIVIGGGGALTMSLLLFLAFAPRMGNRAKTKRRVSLITEGGDRRSRAGRRDKQKSRQKDIQQRLRDAESSKKKEKTFVQRYRKMLRSAGFSISLQQFLLICTVLCLGSAIGYLGLAYLFDLKAVVTIPFAITIGFGLPLYYVKWKGKRRVNRFTLLFADAIDVIVRGVRSGLPIGECLNMIARESPEPVGGVFREIVEAQKLGVTVEQALARAQETMPTNELRFFSIVLTIQSQTGGNLAETLSNLTSVLRARKKMRDKVQALSSEAKTSAMIIGALPPLIMAILCLVNFEYISLLFTEDLGNVLILASMIWMAMGVFIMRQMINFDF